MIVPRRQIWEAVRSFREDEEVIEAIKELFDNDDVIVKREA
jgi:hypothetical protein